MQNCGEIEGVPVAFTHHALQRLVEMELTPNEIKKLILEPEEIFTSRKYPEDICHRRGEYTMAFCREVAQGKYIVKTVLYGSKAAWLKAQRDGKLGEGREVVRLDSGIPNF